MKSISGRNLNPSNIDIIMTTTIETPVAIIGGGLSGLYTAYLLQQQGIKATIFEARDRLGGRIVSLPSSQPAQDVSPEAERYDLGPSWFWPDMHPHMAKLIEDLKLTAFPQYQIGAHLFDRGRGVSPQRHELGFTSSPISMRLSGGMHSLIETLSQMLPADTIRLNHQITEITHEAAGHVTFKVKTADQSSTFSARHLILTLPPRLLASSIQFSPALPEDLLRHCQNTLTWMAAHAKFVAVYDTPFWRQQGLSGSASSQTGPLVEIHDASALEGKPALFGFVGVNAAARKTAGRETLIQVTLKQLADLFGEQAAKPVDTFLIDWSEETFTATEQDQIGANSHPLYGLPASASSLWDNRLIFAGTETSQGAGGYLEGALESALTSASKIAAHLK